MAKEKRLRKGSSTRERGCTHGSASAKINPVDAISGTLLTSIMCSDVARVVMAGSGDDGRKCRCSAKQKSSNQQSKLTHVQVVMAVMILKISNNDNRCGSWRLDTRSR